MSGPNAVTVLDLSGRGFDCAALVTGAPQVSWLGGAALDLPAGGDGYQSAADPAPWGSDGGWIVAVGASRPGGPVLGYSSPVAMAQALSNPSVVAGLAWQEPGPVEGFWAGVLGVDGAAVPVGYGGGALGLEWDAASLELRAPPNAPPFGSAPANGALVNPQNQWFYQLVFEMPFLFGECWFCTRRPTAADRAGAWAYLQSRFPLL